MEHVSPMGASNRASLACSLLLQRLYYVKEAHGIVVTDVAFLPEKGCGPELLGPHETALFSVAVDSRCQLHLLPSRRESLLGCVCRGVGWGYRFIFSIAEINPWKTDCGRPSAPA